MDRRTFVGAALWAFAGPALAQQATSPLDPVKACYNPETKSDQRPYTKRLSALLQAAVKKSKALGEVVSGLDFDPVISGQDHDDDFRKTLKYAIEPRGAGNARVIVKFKPIETEPEATLFYDVVLDGTEWKIDDISNPAKEFGWRWSDMLKLGAKGQ